MEEVVILQKASERSLVVLKEILKKKCLGLEVKLDDICMVRNDWVKIKIIGEDEKATVNLLAQEIGLAPVSTTTVSKYSVYRGQIRSSKRNEDGLFIDIGIFSPIPIYVFIPLRILKSQLVDGKEYSLEKIRKLFGLIDNFPLEVRITNINDETLKAELAPGQMDLFSDWIDSRLDRLIILESTYEEAFDAVKKARFLNNIVSVSSFGFLEQSIVCKLGTVAIGLVSKLGKCLQNSSFACFSPIQIQRLLSNRW